MDKWCIQYDIMRAERARFSSPFQPYFPQRNLSKKETQKFYAAKVLFLP